MPTQFEQLSVEQQGTVMLMAGRIAAKTGVMPEIIAAILAALMPMLANCFKPKPPATPKQALVELAQQHQDSPPWWIRPIIRSKLPTGHRSMTDVYDLWAAIADDVLENPDQVSNLLVGPSESTQPQPPAE